MSTMVIDPGSGYFKSGIATDKNPVVLPSVVGYTKLSIDPAAPKTYYGNEAIKRSCMLNLRYPIEGGIIVSQEDYYQLLSNSFNLLPDKILPCDSFLILSEAPLRPSKERKEIIEHLFETVGILGLHISPSNVLDLYSAGKTTGLILESGECLSSCLGIHEGIICVGSYMQFGVGGRTLNEKMQEVLHQKCGINLLTSAQRETARLIKEQYCEFLSDSESPPKSTDLKEIKLPDGKLIKIPVSALSEISEMLFKPMEPTILTKMSCDFQGLHQLIMKSLEKCDMDSRPDLVRNMILAGGNTCFPNLENRLKFEVSNLMPVSLKAEVKIEARENRNIASWLGGAILGQLSTAKICMLSKKEYEEKGYRGLFSLNL